MEHLTQTRSNCGQTCVAMVAGVTIKEVTDLVAVKDGTYPEDLWLACKLLGVPIVGQWTDEIKYKGNPYPPTCLVRVGTSSGGGHILVRLGNIFYDPHGTTFYSLPSMYTFRQYLEIKETTVTKEIQCLFGGGRIYRKGWFISDIVCERA